MLIVNHIRPVVRAAGVTVALGWLAFALHVTLGLGGHGLDGLFNNWVYNALVGAAAAACLLRAALWRRDRAAWLLIGAGMVSWTAAEVYWSAVLSGLKTVPLPSPADPLY